jgi:hypothetical protein
LNDTETEMHTKTEISAETDTETESFRSLVMTNQDQDQDFSICRDQLLKPVKIIFSVQKRLLFVSVQIFKIKTFEARLGLKSHKRNDNINHDHIKRLPLLLRFPVGSNQINKCYDRRKILRDYNILSLCYYN